MTTCVSACFVANRHTWQKHKQILPRGNFCSVCCVYKLSLRCRRFVYYSGLRKDPNYFVWGNAALSKLAPGMLVWAQYRNYPFWPGAIDAVHANVNGSDTTYTFTVLFFGDNTWLLCECV
jgi:hypothetical protein